jgi:transcriptional regulator with XRE-family HTH domain
MPRPNKPRSIGAEDVLARRITKERTLRGWTLERLAAEMTAVGCPMQMSGIYKIEKGEPRRRITVDELVALSRLWAIPTDRLLTP